MPPEKVCYYKVTEDEAGNLRVQYGTSRHVKSQINTTFETWLRVSQGLKADGYRLVPSNEADRCDSRRRTEGVTEMTDDVPVPNVSPAVLSDTERRVATLLTAGCSDKDIADRIESSKSVEDHLQAIYAKLGINDPVMLSRWVRRFDVARW